MRDAVGLAMVPKLKYEHVNLTSFSKMRVDLAAQVLSGSVATAIRLTGGEEVKETVRFVEFFDKFFDSMNVNNFSAGYKSRNPFKSPYRSESDFRLKVCRNLVNYYGYLMLVCSFKYYSGLQKSSSHTWMNGRKVCKLDKVSQKHRCRKCS